MEGHSVIAVFKALYPLHDAEMARQIYNGSRLELTHDQNELIDRYILARDVYHDMTDLHQDSLHRYYNTQQMFGLLYLRMKIAYLRFAAGPKYLTYAPAFGKIKRRRTQCHRRLIDLGFSSPYIQAATEEAMFGLLIEDVEREILRLEGMTVERDKVHYMYLTNMFLTLFRLKRSHQCIMLIN